MSIKMLAAEATTSAATMYTAPSGAVAVINAAIVRNNTGTARTVEVHIVDNGDSAGDVSRKVGDLNAPANDTVTLPEIVGLPVNRSGTIQILASAASALVVTIGLEELS
jgi:hypothetical protein